MGTGSNVPQEDGQGPWANCCGDSYFERVKIELVSCRILPSLNPGCPGLFQGRASLLLTFVQNLPRASTVLVPLVLQRQVCFLGPLRFVGGRVSNANLHGGSGVGLLAFRLGCTACHCVTVTRLLKLSWALVCSPMR